MQLVVYFNFFGIVCVVMDFYVVVFGGKVIQCFIYGELLMVVDMLEVVCGNVMYLQVEVGSVLIMGVDGLFLYEVGSIIINVMFDILEEVEWIFWVLVEGGEVNMLLEEMFWVYCFGVLIDKFGKYWMVNCFKLM